MATRLALFLWNSIPDEKVRDLAERVGELRKPDVLRAQTERMLDDPRSQAARRGVHRLLARPAHKIDDTSPSTTLYNDYEHWTTPS